jgi:hypothetical protein
MGSCDRRDSVVFFIILICIGYATVLPNALSRTVAFLVFKEQVGKLL